MRRIKAIVKRPDEQYGHMTHVSNTLENLQKTVGGNIEIVNYKNVLIICNESGKLLGLEPNIYLLNDMIVGDIIVCGFKDDEFDHIPIDFQQWKNIVDMSGTDTMKELYNSVEGWND